MPTALEARPISIPEESTARPGTIAAEAPVRAATELQPPVEPAPDERMVTYKGETVPVSQLREVCPYMAKLGDAAFKLAVNAHIAAEEKRVAAEPEKPAEQKQPAKVEKAPETEPEAKPKITAERTVAPEPKKRAEAAPRPKLEEPVTVPADSEEKKEPGLAVLETESKPEVAAPIMTERKESSGPPAEAKQVTEPVVKPPEEIVRPETVKAKPVTEVEPEAPVYTAAEETGPEPNPEKPTEEPLKLVESAPKTEPEPAALPLESHQDTHEEAAMPVDENLPAETPLLETNEVIETPDDIEETPADETIEPLTADELPNEHVVEELYTADPELFSVDEEADMTEVIEAETATETADEVVHMQPELQAEPAEAPPEIIEAADTLELMLAEAEEKEVVEELFAPIIEKIAEPVPAKPAESEADTKAEEILMILQDITLCLDIEVNEAELRHLAVILAQPDSKLLKTEEHPLISYLFSDIGTFEGIKPADNQPPFLQVAARLHALIGRFALNAA
jgi:hypothetical protein